MASRVGFNRLTELESDSSYSNDDEDLMDSSKDKVEKPTLQELQRKAYYSVLQAFAFETSTTSNATKRTEIIEKLKNEWQVDEETHISFVDKIQKDLLTLQERGNSSVSNEKGMQIDQEKPLPKSVRQREN